MTWNRGGDMNDHTCEIPIIDVGALVGGAAAARQVARAVGFACRETGFFYVAGHGIAPELVRRVFALSQQFFALPLDQKQRAAFSGPSGNPSYVNRVPSKKAGRVGKSGAQTSSIVRKSR